MKTLVKSKITAVAIGVIGVVLMSLAPASATNTVRDHRTNKPVVRDHRANAPEVRDHRKDPKPAQTTGGVSVKDTE